MKYKKQILQKWIDTSEKELDLIDLCKELNKECERLKIDTRQASSHFIEMEKFHKVKLDFAKKKLEELK